ncbi:MAG TPA: GNAT family N-acetyltransferase [Acidimicrobiales bacterium]|nr:GNAT family N-acetyltransferase [Acidimicrobiales bacterium]
MGDDNYTYTLHNPLHYTDEEIAQGVEFSNAVQLEALPEDPPAPLEQAIASFRNMPARMKRTSVRAWSPDGQLIGSTGIRIDPDHDDNPDMLFVGLNVLAEHRRNGVGTQLLAYLVALAKGEDRTRLVGDTTGRLPGAEFAELIGAEVKQAVHMNHLPIANVDRALMEKWVADGPSRAEGYEIFGWDGDVPDEHMDSFLAAVLVMNTAPRDDLEMNDFSLTAAQVREQEKVANAVGLESWQLIARRKSDGAWAGIHDVMWNPSEPETVYVGATGVDPEHRGHALGKWLKAQMTLRVMDERPQVSSIRTGNADSNDAMLGINKAMGYVPFISQTVWEVSTADAEQWLKSRGIDVPNL